MNYDRWHPGRFTDCTPFSDKDLEQRENMNDVVWSLLKLARFFAHCIGK